jgi:hypothetical protein
MLVLRAPVSVSTPSLFLIASSISSAGSRFQKTPEAWWMPRASRLLRVEIKFVRFINVASV